MIIVENNKVVSLNYRLTDHNTGEQIEETTEANPMVFLFGVGGVIPEFEENISGKKVGDTFEFVIIADNAYGQYSDGQLAEIPKDVFFDEEGNFDEEYFIVGAVIPMSNSEGHQLRGKIVEINEETIRMDFNHPLAGTDLHFTGEIIDVREATEDELSHGHVHGPGGHHH